jgi:hypothetical protein
MADFFDRLTNGNVPHVKIVLAAVIVALAAYQLVLMAIGSWRAHRASGDTIVALVLFVAAVCISYYGFEGEEDGATVHVVAAVAALALVAVKVTLVRTGRAGRALPYVGTSLFTALVVTFASAAALYWGES